MEKLPIFFPRKALQDLTEILVPKDVPPDSTLELTLSIEDQNVNVREFGAFLSFVDRVYGRLSPEGIYRYSHNERRQLYVTAIEKASIEIQITEMLSQIRESQNLLIVWLVIKYLPTLIKSTTEGIRNIAQSYRDYQEGQLSREKRKQLRSQLQDGEITNKLSEERINQLVDLLDFVYSQEGPKLNPSVRFVLKFVKKVVIKIKSPHEPK
ncbi:MAG TPA: hypothetical protein VGA99_10590 [bacterium]